MHLEALIERRPNGSRIFYEHVLRYDRRHVLRVSVLRGVSHVHVWSPTAGWLLVLERENLDLDVPVPATTMNDFHPACAALYRAAFTILAFQQPDRIPTTPRDKP